MEPVDVLKMLTVHLCEYSVLIMKGQDFERSITVSEKQLKVIEHILKLQILEEPLRSEARSW